MVLLKSLTALAVASVLAACATSPAEPNQAAAANRHLGAPKGAIGRDHTVLNDDLIRATHEQRRQDIATP